MQVIEFGDIAKVDAKGDPLEASLMLGLKHPNIVETIQHKTQQVQVRVSDRSNFPCLFKCH